MYDSIMFNFLGGLSYQSYLNDIFEYITLKVKNWII